MKTYPMSAADASWFHNDGPSNLAVVMGVTLTKEPLDFDRVRQVYSERLVTFERFRQRVVETGFPLPTPHWQDMPNFDINQHLHHVGLPAPHNQAALVALVNDIASAPLDHSIPLWQTWVVDDVDGGSALIMRCHHCIADGTAMMILLQKLYDPAPGAPPLQAPRARGKSIKQVDKGLLAPAINAVTGAARGALALGAGAGMLVGELLRKDDPPSPLKGEFAPAKRVAWSEPFPIADIKAIGLRHGAKVNDVLVAAMTGALRTYLKGRGVDVNNTTLRAMVPVDLRPPERMGPRGPPARADQGPHGRAQAFTGTPGHPRPARPDGAPAQGAGGFLQRPVRAQGQPGDDQRHRPARRAVPGRRPDRAHAGLGAASGQAARHGGEHLQLQGHGRADRHWRRPPGA